jgi:hypothetical protein
LPFCAIASEVPLATIAATIVKVFMAVKSRFLSPFAHRVQLPDRSIRSTNGRVIPGTAKVGASLQITFSSPVSVKPVGEGGPVVFGYPQA